MLLFKEDILKELFPDHKSVPAWVQSIEEGLKQKTRENVVVLDWGSRSKAALGNFGVKVYHCVHRCCTFSLYFCGGTFYVDLYLSFYTETAKSLRL